MVMTILFLKAFFLSFILAIPLGPVGIFCIRRVLSHGLWAGYCAAVAVALGDAFYATIAGFGSAALTQLFVGHRFLISFIGGLFLLVAGLRFVSKKPTEPQCRIGGVSLLGTFIAAFSLTLANPATVVVFFGLFTALKVPASLGLRFIALLGVIVGSLAWWLFLTTLVWALKKRAWVSEQLVVKINVAASLIIVACGAYIMGRSGFMLFKYLVR